MKIKIERVDNMKKYFIVFLMALLVLSGCAKKDIAIINSKPRLQIGWTLQDQQNINVGNNSIFINKSDLGFGYGDNNIQVKLNYDDITGFAANGHRSMTFKLQLQARDENGNLIELAPENIVWVCEEDTESLYGQKENEILYTPKTPGQYVISAIYEGLKADTNARIYKFVTLVYSVDDSEDVGYDFDAGETTYVPQNKDIFIKDRKFITCPYGFKRIDITGTEFENYIPDEEEGLSTEDISVHINSHNKYLIKSHNNRLYKIIAMGWDIYYYNQTNKFHFIYDYAGEAQTQN